MTVIIIITPTIIKNIMDIYIAQISDLHWIIITVIAWSSMDHSTSGEHAYINFTQNINTVLITSTTSCFWCSHTLYLCTHVIRIINLHSGHLFLHIHMVVGVSPCWILIFCCDYSCTRFPSLKKKVYITMCGILFYFFEKNYKFCFCLHKWCMT